MAKKYYAPKDINKNNKLDAWEVAKYEAINSATPMLNTTDGYKHLKATAQKQMGYQMNLNSKQLNTPSAFSNYDYGVMMNARDERNAEYGEGFAARNIDASGVAKAAVSAASAMVPGVVKVEYVNPPGEQNISMQEAGLQDPKDELKEKNVAEPVVITKKMNRVGGKIERLERRKALQEFKGRQRLDKGFTLGANQKRKRIANIEKRQNRLRNRLK